MVYKSQDEKEFKNRGFVEHEEYMKQLEAKLSKSKTGNYQKAETP